MDHKVNTDYEDPGLECIDLDGQTWLVTPDLSGLDTDKVGLYFVTYICAGDDASGIITRFVSVIA